VTILGDRAYWVDYLVESDDFAVYSRPLDASQEVQVVHPHASVLQRDLCAEELGRRELTFYGVDDAGEGWIYRIDEQGEIAQASELDHAVSARYDTGSQCGSDYAGRVALGEDSNEQDVLELIE